MRIRFLLVLGIAWGIQAQPDPAGLLTLVRARIADSLGRLPRYMCTVTIDRAMHESRAGSPSSACDHEFEPLATRLSTSDRLRLDVATTSVGEMYSWVGESRFDDRGLLDMVQDGAISSGSFTTFLNLIFRYDGATFTYSGEKSEGGRALAEFGFRVPYEKSHYGYRYGNRQQWAMVGYGGSFLVDPKTGDLVRLSVETGRLSAETAACHASTTLDYARVRLKGADFLLPTESRLRVFAANGSLAENRTVFSNCHEFLGESTIRFDSPADAPATAAQQPAEQHGLPPGLTFQVVLTQGIDTATAATGDPLKAKLITPIRDRSKVLVPEGAAVAARIARIRHFYGHPSSVTLEIKLETVDVAGASVPLPAVPYIGAKLEQARIGRGVPLGTLHSLQERAAPFEFRDISLPYLIGSGLESMWVTARPAAPDPASPQREWGLPPFAPTPPHLQN